MMGGPLVEWHDVAEAVPIAGYAEATIPTHTLISGLDDYFLAISTRTYLVIGEVGMAVDSAIVIVTVAWMEAIDLDRTIASRI